MITNEVRYMELCYRKSMIEAMIKKAEEENKNEAMILLAQAFDKDIKSKYAGNLALLNRWMNDIDKDIELNKLEEKILNDILKD